MENQKKMCLKRIGILILLIGVVFIMFCVTLIRADAPQYNVCCEKTKTGAWCQNTIQDNCDQSTNPLTGSPFRMSPTSCDATSFCKLGCCLDNQDGLCMKNTPERVCDDSKGTWIDDSECAVSQCNLGCCILGDQASFVTQNRCKALSSLYGLETNFQSNIPDESSCIALAHSQDQGACVYEVDNQKTCKFTTRGDCTNIRKGNNITSGSDFYKDHLCSDEELGTNCGMTKQTICVPGKDEVYFVDSCGNPANIYDASKINDPAYWKMIVKKADSCGYNMNKGNAGSANCGNCDYFQGSICSKGTASYGNYICKDLNCYKTQNGNDYKNGESWCAYQGNVGQGRDAVGSRHFLHICINGEEITEACADFRNEACIQNNLETPGGSFSEAACRTNRWQDCYDQTNKDDCLNLDKRDCFWQDGAYFVRTTSTAQTTQTTSSSSAFQAGTVGSTNPISNIAGIAFDQNQGICLPDVKPGLKIWSNGDSASVCNIGSSSCTVTFEKNILDLAQGNRGQCTDNCECLDESWVGKMNDICTSLGDCGAYVNVAGTYTEGGINWVVNGQQETIQQGFYQEVKSKAGL